MNNKVYRIRDKKTNKFITLGYNSKSSWLVKPLEALRNACDRVKLNLDNYEFVIFELKEVGIEPIKL